MKYLKLLIFMLFIACSSTKEVKYSTVEHAPIYPECEKYNVEIHQECFREKIQKFVIKNFNTALVSGLGLSSGRTQMNISFEVDEKGNVNVLSVKAAHPELEREIIRIFKKLPVMTAGTRNNRAVKMKYYLPISVVVE